MLYYLLLLCISQITRKAGTAALNLQQHAVQATLCMTVKHCNMQSSLCTHAVLAVLNKLAVQ
eukprot:8556-Heterococcus_DN1.PRE.2